MFIACFLFLAIPAVNILLIDWLAGNKEGSGMGRGWGVPVGGAKKG